MEHEGSETDDPDVRTVVAELRADEPAALDRIEWGRFHHAYGTADDVPGLLRALSDRDPHVASRSLDNLWNEVRHQGGSSAPAALAVPFLLRITSDPAVHDRRSVLRLAAEAGHRNHFGEDHRQDMLQVAYPPDEVWIDVSGHPVGWMRFPR